MMVKAIQARVPHAWSCKGLCTAMDLGKRPRGPTGLHVGVSWYSLGIGVKRCNVCEVWIWPPIADTLVLCPCCKLKLRKSSKHQSEKNERRKKRID